MANREIQQAPFELARLYSLHGQLINPENNPELSKYQDIVDKLKTTLQSAQKLKEIRPAFYSIIKDQFIEVKNDHARALLTDIYFTQICQNNNLLPAFQREQVYKSMKEELNITPNITLYDIFSVFLNQKTQSQ